MIDFHTHVLHSIDDGPSDINESLNLALELYAQGITKIVCTPHFDPSKMNIDEFVSKRDLLIAQLQDALPSDSSINLFSGAEVYLSNSLIYLTDIHKLCVHNTNLILVELPVDIKWSDNLRKIIEFLVFRKSLRVIIAHAERYTRLHKHAYRYIQELINMDCIIQINCDFVSEKFKSSVSFDMLKHGIVNLIATDCHGIKYRPPEYDTAKKIIISHLGENAFMILQNNAEKLLLNKSLKSKTLFF